MLPAGVSLQREQLGARPVITMWWLVVACALLVICPKEAMAETLVGETRVFQRYMIDTSGLPVEFDYQLVAADPSAPMPEGSLGTTYTWTFRRDDEAMLQIPVDTETMASGKALYTYAMRPASTKLSDGLYYDTSFDRALEYTLEVYTFDKSVFGEPIVQTIVRNPDGTKVSDPGWYICWHEREREGSDSPDTPAPVVPTPDTPTPDTPTPDTTSPDTSKPDVSLPDATRPDETATRDTSSSSRATDRIDGGAAQATNARTSVTQSERIAQTADNTTSDCIALMGGMGLACLVLARVLRCRKRAA